MLKVDGLQTYPALLNVIPGPEATSGRPTT